jgi:hypothetical protein
MAEMEKKEEKSQQLIANEVMEEMGLKGKPIMNKILEIITIVGNDKNKIKGVYSQFKEKEAFANEIMAEVGLKGKSTRIKVMRIMDMVGWDKQKIKISLLRSTINSRIKHN